MGAHHDHSHEHTHDRHILWIAFALNFPLFVIEIWQGLAASSISLIANSMDFLSDSASYLITLYVLTKPLHIRARASLFKAAMMLLVGGGALWQAVDNITHNITPLYHTMGWVALLALAANVATAWLLYGTRKRDSNMESIWLCSRNDAIADILILLAAGAVFLTDSLWPDLAVALVIVWLSGSAAIRILRHARSELAGH